MPLMYPALAGIRFEPDFWAALACGRASVLTIATAATKKLQIEMTAMNLPRLAMARIDDSPVSF
jgi:hypothetical protein